MTTYGFQTQIADFADQRYADRSSRNVLDIYMPKGVSSPPLVLWIHAGAFKFGDKAEPRGLDELLKAGFAVASMNYRYSSEAIWPAQLDDIKSAVLYLRREAVRRGYDGNRMATFGASAGGHLSAVAGIALAGDASTKLQASVVWFAPVDFPTMDEDIESTGVKRVTGRKGAADSPESQLVGAPVYEKPDIARNASPLTYLAALPEGVKPPPFLIMHGAVDAYIGRGQSERLHNAITDRYGTASAQYRLLPNGGHGDGDFKRPESMAAVVAFLSKSLGL